MPILVANERVGQFHTVRATTGVLGAQLAADATIFAMRNATAATSNPLYITRVSISFAGVAAFTAASQQTYALERFITATPSGGTAYTGFKHDTTVPTSGVLDARASTTAALTVTSVVFEGNQIPILATGAPAAGSLLAVPDLDFSLNPLVLRAGQGLCIKNVVVWPAAGTGTINASITWYE